VAGPGPLAEGRQGGFVYLDHRYRRGMTFTGQHTLVGIEQGAAHGVEGGGQGRIESRQQDQHDQRCE